MKDKTPLLLLLSEEACSLLGPSRATARALLRDFHPGVQLPRQGGGSLALLGSCPPDPSAGDRRSEGAKSRPFLEGQQLGSLAFYPVSAYAPTPGPRLHICKRSRVYLIVAKSDSATTLFLTGPEPFWMAELPSTVFRSIHAVFTSRYFLRMEMEGE